MSHTDADAAGPSPGYLASVEEALANALDNLGKEDQDGRSSTVPGEKEEKTNIGFTISKPSTPAPFSFGKRKADDEFGFLDSKAKHVASLLGGPQGPLQQEETPHVSVGSIGQSGQQGEPKGAFQSLEDAMEFPKSFLAELFTDDEHVTEHSDDPHEKQAEMFSKLNEVVTYLEETSHSSSFSGIGAPETGLMLLHKEVQRLLPDKKVLWIECSHILNIQFQHNIYL